MTDEEESHSDAFFPLSSIVGHASFPVMNIGFKEWALICEALGEGRQSILLRKGGIAEGRTGFQFEHRNFLLFPTLFHEQVSQLKLPADTPLPERPGNGQIQIHYAAHVEWTHHITDLEVALRLAPLHFWQDTVVEERFRYDDKPGINLAFLRVSRLSQPWVFPDAPRYGGCRSWVTLPELPATVTTVDVLDERTQRERETEIRAIITRSF